MKNIVYALILSLFIHIIILLSFDDKKELDPKILDKTSDNNQIITYVKIKKRAPVKSTAIPFVLKNTIEKKKITQKQIKLKKVDKKKFTKIKKRKTIKVAKEITPKPSLKTIAKPTYTRAIPKKINPIKKSKTLVLKKDTKKNKSLDKASKKSREDTLESFLSAPSLNKQLIDSVTQSYLNLYGEEYNSFTKVQKVFLKKNLRGIGLITQKYMWYPRVSARTKQAGTNVVEFMLHPNGDIGKIVLTTSSGYEALDKSSISTIKIAFKDYPKPKVSTKVKIYMTYIYN